MIVRAGSAGNYFRADLGVPEKGDFVVDVSFAAQQTGRLHGLLHRHRFDFLGRAARPDGVGAELPIVDASIFEVIERLDGVVAGDCSKGFEQQLRLIAFERRDLDRRSERFFDLLDQCAGQ